MPLKDILHKKDRINEKTEHVDYGAGAIPTSLNGQPEFRFYRTDTNTQEAIQPPTFENGDGARDRSSREDTQYSPPSQRRLSLFNRPSNKSPSLSPSPSPTRAKGERRLSHLLHLDRSSRNTSSSSVNVPVDLPQIDTNLGDKQDREAQWEKRATILVQGNLALSPSSPRGDYGFMGGGRSRSSSSARINDPEGDVRPRTSLLLASWWWIHSNWRYRSTYRKLSAYTRLEVSEYIRSTLQNAYTNVILQ